MFTYSGGGEGNGFGPKGKCGSHLANMWSILRPSCNESITTLGISVDLEAGVGGRGGGTMRT